MSPARNWYAENAISKFNPIYMERVEWWMDGCYYERRREKKTPHRETVSLKLIEFKLDILTIFLHLFLRSITISYCCVNEWINGLYTTTKLWWVNLSYLCVFKTNIHLTKKKETSELKKKKFYKINECTRIERERERELTTTNFRINGIRKNLAPNTS